MRLLLFDIDGTLISSGGQAGRLFTSALEVVYGTPGNIASYDFGGKTDPQIVLDLMTAEGISRHEVLARLPAMRRLYLAQLEAELEGSRMRLMPGVVSLLERLAGRPDLTLGLLTGNWEPGARTKLSRVDLNRFFPFGAYGEDGIERHELVPAAFARARAVAGRAFAPEEALIIGDTVHDVSCGRAHGVPVLGVATGRTPLERLQAAGAAFAARDLDEACSLLPVLAA